MRKNVLTISLILAGSCADDRNSPKAASPGPTDCDLHFKRTCIVSDDTKCVAYETKELNNCNERK